MNEPIDVATAETVAFLTKYLPRSAQSIEVSCGEGHVAQPYFCRRSYAMNCNAGSLAKIELTGRRIVAMPLAE